MIGEKTHKRGRNVRKFKWPFILKKSDMPNDCRSCANSNDAKHNHICDECRVREDLTFTKWTAKK